MRAQLTSALIFAFLVPGFGAAQSLPCGDCYDRFEQAPATVYELLPGGDDPRKPAPVGAMAIPSDEFNVGVNLSSLRGMPQTTGTRTLILRDGRRAVQAIDSTLCPGTIVGSLTETFGGVEWRITGCADGTSEGGALARLLFEEAQPSDRASRYLLYVRSANGDYRVADIGESGDQPSAYAALDALRALAPADLEALQRRLLRGDRSE